MPSEAIESIPALRALQAHDPEALTGASAELGEALGWVRPEKIEAACRFLKDEQGFERLVGITAIDRYPLEPRFEVVYLLHSIRHNSRLKLKVALRGESPTIATVTGVWAGANWYERETWDMFGIRIEGHPNLKRLLMPEEWEGYPLRRDFPIHGHKYSYKDE